METISIDVLGSAVQPQTKSDGPKKVKGFGEKESVGSRWFSR